MSLFATLSALVLTGAATPVSITAYQDANNSARPWLQLKPPAYGIMTGDAVNTEPGTAVSRARGMLYTQLVNTARIVRVRVLVGSMEMDRVYDVISSRVIDGVRVLELETLWEDGA